MSNSWAGQVCQNNIKSKGKCYQWYFKYVILNNLNFIYISNYWERKKKLLIIGQYQWF